MVGSNKKTPVNHRGVKYIKIMDDRIGIRGKQILEVSWVSIIKNKWHVQIINKLIEGNSMSGAAARTGGLMKVK